MKYLALIVCLAAAVLVSTRGAPMPQSDDMMSKLDEFVNILEGASRNEQPELPVIPATERLPEFDRTEVKINDCPTCVADSFRWENKK